MRRLYTVIVCSFQEHTRVQSCQISSSWVQWSAVSSLGRGSWLGYQSVIKHTNSCYGCLRRLSFTRTNSLPGMILLAEWFSIGYQVGLNGFTESLDLLLVHHDQKWQCHNVSNSCSTTCRLAYIYIYIYICVCVCVCVCIVCVCLCAWAYTTGIGILRMVLVRWWYADHRTQYIG